MYIDDDIDKRQLREAVRRFTESVLEPIAMEIDRSGTVPPALAPLLRDQGYLGMRLPEHFGGGGFSLENYCLVMEEFSRSHRVFTLVLDASSGLAPIGIARFGSEEQKARYVTKLATGAQRASFALTEPEAGSDSAAIRCAARKVEGGWIIDGTKHYISGAEQADLVLLVAVTDPQLRAKGGITTFLVDKGTEGFHVDRVETTIGSEAIKLAELRFENCFVPDGAVLGEVGNGFKVAMASLTSGRLGVAAACLGTASRVLDMAARHANDRSTFGKPLAERQAIQWMLADSEVDVEVGRSFLYDTLRKADAGQDVGTASSICKLYCSEMVGRVTDRAVQIFGGMGLVRGFPIERFYRDVRHYRVGEGTSEVQRMLIARDVLSR